MRPQADIFSSNGTATKISVPVPKEDSPIEDTTQLVLCVNLLLSYAGNPTAPKPLSSALSCPPANASSDQKKWIQFMVENKLEVEHLHKLMNRMVDKFIQQPTRSLDSIREIVLVGPMLDKDNFRQLVASFLDEFERTPLLRVDILLGLVQLVQDAPANFLKQDDLTRILQSVRGRLEDSNQKSTDDTAYLILAASVLLSVLIASPKACCFDREKEHKPLLEIISELRKSKDPLVRFQAKYTSQLLLAISHNENKRKEFCRHIFGLTGGLLGMSGVITLQFDGVAENLPGVYDSTVGLFNLIKRVFGSDTQKGWFVEIQKAEEYARKGQFQDLNMSISSGPACTNINFQWRACQLLGEIAAEPMWDDTSRIQALDLLKEYYMINSGADLLPDIRRWVLTIVHQISELPFTYLPTGAVDTSRISNQKVKDKALELVRGFSRTGDKAFESVYPLRRRLPLPKTSTLLNMVNSYCDLDTLIDRLRRQRSREYNRRLKNEDRSIYVEPMSKPNLKATDNTGLSPLKDRAQLFMNGEAKVLLILGDSGSGKSTFSRHLEFELWRAYKPRDFIPLFIDLKTVTDDRKMVEEHLAGLGLFSEKQILRLKESRRLILICDGYDERRGLSNLYDDSRLWQWNMKMTISCRSQFVGRDYRAYFQPHADEVYSNIRSNGSDLFEEAAIVPFRQDQIQNYVEQYLMSPDTQSPIGWIAERFIGTINQVPHLAGLVTNPFLLGITLDTLPGLVDSSSDLSKIQISRVRLYDAYVIHRFQMERNRLAAQISKMDPDDRHAFCDIKDDFVHAGIDYMKRLVAAIFKHQELKDAVEYASSVGAPKWKKKFFSEDPKAKLCRVASPLDRSGSLYIFSHRSMFEYFFSRLIFEPKTSPSGLDVEQKDNQDCLNLTECFDSKKKHLSIAKHPFGKLDLVSEPSILHFLVERVSQSAIFKEQLFQIISLSKAKPRVGRAAANAISILVKAGVHFNGFDLKGIQIRGADLSEGQFDSVQLQDADLRDVSLQGTWLRQANFRDAKMNGVNFGVKICPLTGELHSSAISSDGTKIGVQMEDGGIHIYDTSGSWQILGALNEESYRDTKILAVSNNGMYVALRQTRGVPLCGQVEPQLLIWSFLRGANVLLSGKMLKQADKAEFSPDNCQLVAVNRDGVMWIWDVYSGTRLMALEGDGFHVAQVAWSKDGRRIAVTGRCQNDGQWEARVLDAQAPWHPGQTIGYVPQGTSCIAISPEGQHLVVGCDSCDVPTSSTNLYLWDLLSGSNESRILLGHTTSISSVAFSGDGQWIVSLDDGGWIRVWKSHTGQLVRTWKAEGGEGRGVYFSSNQKVISAQQYTMRLWDLSFNNDFLQQESVRFSMPSGIYESTPCIGYSFDGNSVLLSSLDNWTVQSWDARTGTPVHSEGLDDCFTCIQSSHQHASAHESPACHVMFPEMTPGQSTRFQEYDLSGGMEIAEPKDSTKIGCIFTYTRCRHWMASGDRDGVIRIWDVQSCRLVETWKGHPDEILSLNFSPDGSQLASSCRDCKTYLWSMVSARRTEFDIPTWVKFCYSPCGRMIIICDHMGETLRIWDVQAEEFKTVTRTSLKHGGELFAVAMAWSSSGWLVIKSIDLAIRLWRVTVHENKEVVATFKAILQVPGLETCNIACNPQEGSLEFVTGSLDKSVCVWRVIEEGEDSVRFRLVWGCMPKRLCLSDANVSGATGLGEEQGLLRQLGAIDDFAPLVAESNVRNESIHDFLRKMIALKQIYSAEKE
ncbi:hypothetical protein EMPS_09958 [Entomortierella parvispora]|uniref:NACHT domain-containing protein n=1 Tax=Entomortierella parvispora TaxID=205924 RepID=A0A9P3HIY1_9FUNG|nr:hypothetical protein EMPS_09958 [Entomortierella parvispora]